MDDRQRRIIVTTVGLCAIVMGAVRAAFALWVLHAFDRLWQEVGQYPVDHGKLVAFAVVSAAIRLTEVAAGIGILKGYNWGRIVFALVAPALLVAGVSIHGFHLPRARWWTEIVPEVVFSVALFSPLVSRHFRRSEVAES